MNLSLFHNEGLEFKDDFEQNIAQIFLAIAISESPPCLTYRLLVTPSAVRQYSLLTVIIIGSSVLLLQALRLKTWRTWILYGLVCAMGLYTHLFFGLTLIAHAVSVFCYGVFSRRPWLMLKYLSAIAITSLHIALGWGLWQLTYRPSGKLRDILKSKVGQLEAVSRNAGLWQLKLYNSIH